MNVIWELTKQEYTKGHSISRFDSKITIRQVCNVLNLVDWSGWIRTRHFQSWMATKLVLERSGVVADVLHDPRALTPVSPFTHCKF